MDKKTKFNLGYVFIAIWGVVILHSLWVQYANPVEQIPYSQFQTYLADGKIEEVRIGPDSIRGKLKERQRGIHSSLSLSAWNPILPISLPDAKVKFSGEIEDTFLHDLLSWVLPTLLFFGLWMFLMRRFAQREGLGGGFLAIGKSKAKIYMEKDVKVSFADVAGVDEAKTEFQEVIEFLQDPRKISSTARRAGHGARRPGDAASRERLLRAGRGVPGTTARHTPAW